VSHDCKSELQRFSRDRFGSRLLLMAMDQLSTSSLRQFLHQVTGDPLIAQLVIAQQAGVYNVCLMRRSARRAAGSTSVHPDEKDAVFAAALVARLGDLAEALARQGAGLSVPLPELHRRWRYLLGVALRRLAAEDAPNACVVRLALGCPMPDEGRAADSARLQTVVALAWAEICSRMPGYYLSRVQPARLANKPDPPTRRPS
jgi:hypothetical protein